MSLLSPRVKLLKQGKTDLTLVKLLNILCSQHLSALNRQGKFVKLFINYLIFVFKRFNFHLFTHLIG